MAKIYNPPKGYDPPEWNINKDTQVNLKAEDDYLEKLKTWAEQNGKGKMAGKMIRFPVADGYALYVVFSLKPVQLIHVPIGDAWNFQYAHRLTAKDVQDEVRSLEGLRELFASKKSTPLGSSSTSTELG